MSSVPGALALLALALAGCEVELDDEPSAAETDKRFYRTDERCTVASPVSVKFSLSYPQGVYVISADGAAGVALAATDDPCVELLPDETPERPVVSLLDFTAEERAQGLETDDGYRLLLVPLSGFVVGDEGYLFYEKRLQRGIFEAVRVGVGVARLPFGEPAERLEPKRFISEPTLLWLDSRAGRASSAVMGTDGFAYLYDIFVISAFRVDTYLSRVPPADVADPAAYEYFGDDGWEDTPERGRRLISGITSLSVARNAYLDRYVFLYPAPLSDTVIGQIADFPWGPFAQVTPLYEGTAPTDFWIRDVAVHEGLGSADGRSFLTSYYTTPPDEAPGLRLVDVTLR